jgi:hypothetical protein
MVIEAEYCMVDYNPSGEKVRLKAQDVTSTVFISGDCTEGEKRIVLLYGLHFRQI